MTTEFVVSAEKRCVIQLRLARIQDVFCVRVRWGDPGPYGGAEADSGCIMPAANSEANVVEFEESDAIQWVYIDGAKEKCQRAKEHILSLCSENRVEEECPSLPPDMLDRSIRCWEYESGAAIERLPGDRLQIQGADENILRARSLISTEAVPACSDRDHPRWGSDGSSSSSPNDTRLQNGAISSRGVSPTNTASPGVDLGDSGTVDDQPDGGRRPEPREVREKAVPSMGGGTGSGSSSNGRREEIIALMQKLGYSRPVVEQALQQLGGETSKNEVLQMLVSQGPAKGCNDDDDAAERRRGDGGGTSSSSSSSVVVDTSDGVEEAEDKDLDPYRPVIIDGSNVAMSYGNKNVFACKGIDHAVMWFFKRNHKVIYVFVPSWRKEQSKPETPIQDQEILIELEKAKILVWTPSRRVKGRRLVCYDDRYILNLAIEMDGIVVSNDTFRDLCAEKTDYRKVVEERLLMYSFAGEKFMPPDDPLGRYGPSLDDFLRKSPSKPTHQMQACPYGKKCTYGNKCKYSHPERSKNQKSTSEILVERDRQRKERKIKAELQARALDPNPVVMPWNKDGPGGARSASVGRGNTEPLGSSAGHDAQGSMAPPGHAPPPHGGAATLPLMSPHVPRGSVSSHNLSSIGERWQQGHPPDQRVPPFHHPATHQVHHHQHPRNQPLPNRTALTAPLPGYAPHPHRQMVQDPGPPSGSFTAPLTSQENLNYHSANNHRRGYVVPSVARDTSYMPAQPLHFPREGSSSALGSFPVDFQQMSLHDQSHVTAFGDERVHTYPLTTPYSGSLALGRHGSDLGSQTSMAVAVDEGYVSPRHPVDRSAPSAGPPAQHPSTQGYTANPGTESVHRPSQQSYQFRFSSAPGWGQQQSMQGMPIPQPTGRLDPHGNGHVGVHQGPHHQGPGQHSFVPRRGAEQIPSRSAWGEVEEDQARIYEMRRSVPSQLPNH